MTEESKLSNDETRSPGMYAMKRSRTDDFREDNSRRG